MNNIQTITDERGKRYGDFGALCVTSAQIKQTVRDALLENETFQKLDGVKKCVVEEYLDMVATKLARIVTGDPTYDDNFLDIEGYSKITRERICKPRSE